MKYVCLGYIEENKWEHLSESERNAMMDECFAYDDVLRENGHFAGGEALQSSQSATTLRWIDGKLSVTDGPYAETKEVLGGILLLEARDLDHAIELMSKHPGVKAGPFEIRPAADLAEMIRHSERRRKKGAEPASGPTAERRLASRPPVVSEAEWRAARERLLAKEKETTEMLDALAAERRRLPMVRIEKDYTLEGPDGEASLSELFDGRRQLLLYHFMFAPSVDGWPDAGCIGCSMFADNVGHLAHLHARDTSLAFVSRGPLENLERYRRRMGWTVPWYSSAGSDFNDDFGATSEDGHETHGLSVFLRDGDEVFRTYDIGRRGVEALGTNWSFLDLTPLGRQEDWEDSPEGFPQTSPYQWWRRHDEYGHSGS